MKISEKARTLLAEEYERHGKYPTYAQQAMTSDAEFTMCSLRAIERALAPAQQVPGGGWKLVPVEPTSEMLVAALKTNGVCPQYAAMLAAAPQPPVGGDVEVLGYRAQRIEPVKYERLNRPLLTTVSDWGPAFVVTELVDRAHVTARDQQIAALQAQLASSEKWAREHCNRAEDFAGQILEMKDQAEARDQQITALQARVAELEADAARYRWLREASHFDTPQHQVFCKTYADGLDAEIDAALSAYEGRERE